jgi:HEAT repeat protein
MPKACAAVLLLTVAMGGCGGPTAALESQLVSGTPAERAAAARSLAEMGPQAAPAVGSLSKALQDSDADVRKQAAHALGRIGPMSLSAVPAMKGGLADSDRSVRLSTAYALVAIDPTDKATLPVLGEAARGGDPRACIALGQMGPAAEDAIPDLVIAASNSRALVRAKAVAALRNVGSTDRRAVGALERARQDPSDEVRAAASR